MKKSIHSFQYVRVEYALSMVANMSNKRPTRFMQCRITTTQKAFTSIIYATGEERSHVYEEPSTFFDADAEESPELSISTSPSDRISPNSDVIDDETFTKEKYKI